MKLGGAGPGAAVGGRGVGGGTVVGVGGPVRPLISRNTALINRIMQLIIRSVPIISCEVPSNALEY